MLLAQPSGYIISNIALPLWRPLSRFHFFLILFAVRQPYCPKLNSNCGSFRWPAYLDKTPLTAPLTIGFSSNTTS